MKYITLMIGLLVMGCVILTPEEKKVVGTYEVSLEKFTGRMVFLENGIVEGYENGKKEEEAKWKISKDGELHIARKYGDMYVYRINKDGSITMIATIDKDGKRTDTPKEWQGTFKKIK